MTMAHAGHAGHTMGTRTQQMPRCRQRERETHMTKANCAAACQSREKAHNTQNAKQRAPPSEDIFAQHQRWVTMWAPK